MSMLITSSPKTPGHSLPARALSRISTVLAIIACGVLLGANTASATSTPITLGTANNYGFFTGVGETVNVGGGFKITGNEGQALDYNNVYAGANSVSGTWYYDNSDGKGAYSGASGSTASSGALVNQSMTQVVADAVSASKSAGALAATTSVSGGKINSSITIQALTNLSENVLTISSLSLANSTLTFDDNGYTGAKFIINVTGGFSISGTSTIKGINGASASDILFNIEGTGQTVSITGSGQMIGTLLVPASNVTIGGGGTLTGALITGANNLGKSYTVTEQSSGINITSLPYIARTATKVPEPSSIALFGTSVLIVTVLKRRRRKEA